MKALPIFIILIVFSAAPAYAFSLSDITAPFEDIFSQLNKLFYSPHVIGELNLFKANYDIVKGVYVEKTSWSIISGNTSFKDNINILAAEPKVGVIIQFKRLPSVNTIYKIANSLGAEVYHIDRGINAVSLKLVDKPALKEWIEQNASELNVASVYLDFTLRVPENFSVPWMGKTSQIEKELPIQAGAVEISKKQMQDASWNDKQISATEVWGDNITGRGVVIALLDTGVDEKHPMLNGSIIGSISMVDGEDAHDYNGHGTHTAGIAAGRPVLASIDGQTVWVSGVAPNAKILNVKVLGRNGAGSLSTVIKGLDYVASWKDRHPEVPVVVSMSLGTPLGNPSDPVSQKVDWMVQKKHIPVVVAAGNEYVLIDSPGLAEDAMTVAAVDRNGQVASFSGKGPGTNWKDIKPDISAPGVDIASARANTRELVEMSGTSMATPHVAGVIALILEKNPELQNKPARIKELLQSTAVDHPEIPYIFEGAGEVDAYAAVLMMPKRQLGIMAHVKSLFGGE